MRAEAVKVFAFMNGSGNSSSVEVPGEAICFDWSLNPRCTIVTVVIVNKSPRLVWEKH